MAVNYADHQSKCYVRVAPPNAGGRALRFTDLAGSAVFDRDREEVASRGLYLDMPAWSYHVFQIAEAR